MYTKNGLKCFYKKKEHEIGCVARWGGSERNWGEGMDMIRTHYKIINNFKHHIMYIYALFSVSALICIPTLCIYIARVMYRFIGQLP